MCYRIGARAHNRKKRFASGERWREIVTSMDVAWGSGGARASGLRLTQLYGLWWRIYGLGSRERCLPENQASPSTDPFLSSSSYSLPPFFFFSFSSVSRFLLLLLLSFPSFDLEPTDTRWIFSNDFDQNDSTLTFESVRKFL